MHPSANSTHTPIRPCWPSTGLGGNPDSGFPLGEETPYWVCSNYIAGAFGSDTFSYTEVVGLDTSKFNKTQPLPGCNDFAIVKA